MTEYKLTEEHFDRRRKEDFWSKLPGIMGMLGWLALLISLMIIGAAKPSHQKVFGFSFDGYVRDYWRTSILDYALYCIIGALSLGVAGLLINSKRRRRRKDFFRDSLVLLTIISTIGLVSYLYNF